MELTLQELEAERTIGSIISEVEGALEKGFGHPRKPGERMGSCGIAVDLVKRSAERHGTLGKVHQVMYVHRTFGGIDKNSFQHGFNIVTIGDQRYLVDESFCQFIDPDSQMISQGIGLSSGSLSQYGVAERLLTRGYVMLTDESFRDYLRVTSVAEDKGYIDKATVDELMNDPSSEIPYDHTIQQLDAFLNGEAVNR